MQFGEEKSTRQLNVTTKTCAKEAIIVDGPHPNSQGLMGTTERLTFPEQRKTSRLTPLAGTSTLLLSLDSVANSSSLEVASQPVVV